MVDGERRDDEVERTVGQPILEPGDPELDAVLGQYGARAVEHLAARVDADEHRPGMDRQHAARRLAGSCSELERALGGGPGRAGSFLLEALVVGHLVSRESEVAVRIPVKLRDQRDASAGGAA